MVIFSATKQMNNNGKLVDFQYNDNQQYIIDILKAKSKEDLAKFYKIKNKTLDLTYDYFHNYDIVNRAIDAYQGISYKQIIDKDNVEDVYIISALYGIVRADELIKNYRLDFTNKVFESQNLYMYHKEYITNVINNNSDTDILNLCSEEYYKAYKNLDINKNIIDVVIVGDKPNSVFLKKMRGQLLNYILENKIKDYKLINGFENELFKASYKDNNIIIKFKENNDR